MTNNYERRYSRWYERIIFNSLFQFLLGFSIVVILPSALRWGTSIFSWPLTAVQFNSLVTTGCAFILAFGVFHKLRRYPSTQTLAYIVPTLTICWLLVFTVLLLIRQDTFSRQVLLFSFILANIWALCGFFLYRRYMSPKLAVVPFGRAVKLTQTPHAKVEILQAPDLHHRRFDAVVADLHAKDLPAEWQRFLANCTLARIPVYHSQRMLESLTGRVKINHLSENIFGSLQPSVLYAGFKRGLEFFTILATAPIWLSIILITGVFIKLESSGPVFFIQNRVGQGNKDFKLYKLRSMTQDSEDNGAQFAQANDFRVTKVGKFIRKTRIDELPQFINILKGDMSLIGPRPEQRHFVDQYDEEIPFYAYRHVVRPGITGWAQVEQGYAASTDDTRLKIEHDFYYIKNFSFWLDLLIIAKTIKTIFTGFGAR